MSKMPKYFKVEVVRRDTGIKVTPIFDDDNIVEVIRCKDCKYSESVPKWKDFEFGCMLRREYITATDFCSQAERRESE